MVVPSWNHVFLHVQAAQGGIYPTGLRPIPPPCLGYGLEASCMCVGISWYASRGPLECSFEASWGPFWGLGGSFWGLLLPQSERQGESPILIAGSPRRAVIFSLYMSRHQLHGSRSHMRPMDDAATVLYSKKRHISHHSVAAAAFNQSEGATKCRTLRPPRSEAD